MNKISCIIPAYNEAPRIGHVLDVIAKHSLIDEVIVVDDGSDDEIRDVVVKYPNVKFIVHTHNRGKSASVYTGIIASTCNYLLFVDADLIGLSSQDITNLILPIREDKADVTISLRGNTPQFWHLIGLDYISGERVFPKKLFDKHLIDLLAITGFGLEVFMNQLIIKNKYRIKIVQWPKVSSPHKHDKHGLKTGIKEEVGMFSQMFKTVSVFGVILEIYRMRRLRVK